MLPDGVNMRFKLAFYSLLHFLVDLAAVYLVVSVLKPQVETMAGYIYLIVFYNMFAFALQLPIGIIADSLHKNSLVAACGCALLAAAYILTPFTVVSCVLAGLGNAAFHIGGGADILHIGGGKAAYPGIFVSTGALGVWLAVKTPAGLPAVFLVLMLFLVLALLLYYFRVARHEKHMPAVTGYKKPASRLLAAALCLLVTVCLRSYIGTVLSFDWKSSLVLSVLFIAGVFAGKLFGGILGDKIGWMKLSVPSLALSAVLFVFAFDSPAAGIIAVFLFNMTMPITLTALANLLPGKAGFTFGLTTFALFIGFLPTVFTGKTVLFMPAYLLAGTLLSAAAIAAGLALYGTILKKGRIKPHV